jgi:hypothetical protein
MPESSDLNRRDFHKLSMAAMGGVLAGSLAGCDAKPAGNPPATGGQGAGQAPETPRAKKGSDGDSEIAAADVHVCRGLNACKNQGAGGKNECAGLGDCATASTHHACGGQNACKGQGGCGETAGANDCKEQGACSVPLMNAAWKGARKRFEDKMKKAGKTVGPAPKAKK